MVDVLTNPDEMTRATLGSEDASDQRGIEYLARRFQNASHEAVLTATRLVLAAQRSNDEIELNNQRIASALAEYDARKSAW